MLRAVAVDAIPAEMLDWGTVLNGIPLDRLPTTEVEDPEDLRQKPAVLSWRWDRTTYEGRSRNVALALMHARRSGIRRLFLDQVTVDQSLPNEQLLRDVAGLARLYSRIPVIAAYDEEGKKPDWWYHATHRPWIRYEIRSFCVNPTCVTHVGFHYSHHRPSFEEEMLGIRNSGYANVVMEIINGSVEMMSITDFRLILPPFEEIFSAAAKSFNRADYLLAVFLLIAADENPTSTIERGGKKVSYGRRLGSDEANLENLQLQRFSLKPHEGAGHEWEFWHDILLDGQAVAIRRARMTTGHDRGWIEVLPNIADRVFAAVGLGPESLERFKRNRQARRAALYVDEKGKKAEPDVEQLIARIQDGSWSVRQPDPVYSKAGRKLTRRLRLIAGMIVALVLAGASGLTAWWAGWLNLP